MRYFYKSVFAAFFGLMSFAAAADYSDYTATYNEFRQAAEDGRLNDALVLIEKALAEAEAEAANQQTMDALVQNYLNVARGVSREETAKAYLRLLPLAEAGSISMNEAEATLGAAYYTALLAPEDQGKRKALDDALSAPALAEGVVPILKIQAGLWLGKQYLDDKKFDDADRIAKRVADPLWTAGEKYRTALVGANAIRIVSMLRPTKSEKNLTARVKNVIVLTDNTMALYPPQPSAAQFDKNLALIYAWQGTARSMLSSLGSEMEAGYAFEGMTERDKKPPFIANKEACPNVNWKKRKAPEIPALPTSYPVPIGAVVLSYDLSDKGRVKSAKVLSEVPATLFGPAVIQTAEKRWVANVTDLPVECRQDNLTLVNYELGRP